jgi:hypothetical protein
MARNFLRQSSLILGSGPGALTVLQDGSTVMIPGIDAWYITKRPPLIQSIPNDVIIHDPQLQANLGVDYFVLPPAEGISEIDDTDYIHTSLFPCWLVCYSCKSLIEVHEPNVIKCDNCRKLGKPSRKMVQTNFVVACEDGHLDDFPWIDWVHRGADNVCANPVLSFRAKGAVQLSSQRVSCECSQSRDLGRTSNANEDGTTYLSTSLESGREYTCSGAQPWLRIPTAPCNKHIRMVLRSASNIYFSNSISSILVPTKTGLHQEARQRIEASNMKNRYLAMLLKADYDFTKIAQAILVLESDHYAGISENELKMALMEEFLQAEVPDNFDLDVAAEFDRSPEWHALSAPREDKELVVRTVGDFDFSNLGIKKIHSVPTLKKTTALKGFSRLRPEEISPAKGRQLLRRNPFVANANWLPAIQQTGEGIFLTLDEARLNEWESQSSIISRVKTVEDNLRQNGRELHRGLATPRFMLLHTFAHVLIQELVIECGYTSASLAERIYADTEQAGILIYTASTSSDGTMGGLVEMSDPKFLESVIIRALERSQWCSNDPVCMELGKLGQGNFGSNLAACHNCCLLPETACEHFNQGLDRGMLIGTSNMGQEIQGFFNRI